MAACAHDQYTRAGGAFAWVSSPHYLGEIVIYAGLALGFGSMQPLLWVVLTWVVRRYSLLH